MAGNGQVRDIERFFHRSLTRLRGTFDLGGRTFEYLSWRDEPLDRTVAIDTETVLIDGPTVPELALLTAFDGSGTVWLVHPSRVARFVRTLPEHVLVFHNVAFDYHVIRHHLFRCDKPKTAALWQGFVDQGMVADTMLLDQLVRLARGRFPKRRNLEVLAARYANILDLDKDDPYRLHYGEIIGQDWRTVDRGFWSYAAKDPVATYHVYQELRKTAQELIRQHRVPKAARKLHGLLNQKTQVKAAIVLADIGHRGICLDQQKRADAEQHLRQEMSRLVDQVSEYSDRVFKRTKKTGALQLTPSGKPRTDNTELARVLVGIADEQDIAVPTTAKTGKPSLARSFWITYSDADPFIETWTRLDEISKLVQFFAGLQTHRIYPQYETLVRTGRTSCKRPNVQQIPRSGNLREMFVPTPGYYMLAIDYSALELRTLAANCERLYGHSTLADVIRSGRDPHAYTAALMLGMKPDQFDQLKESEPDQYKTARQKAKAVNFGIPGGLGAKSLVMYARVNYGAQMSLDEAETFRQRFLDEIYPEIGEYMSSDVVQVLAGNLHVKPREVLAAFGGEPAILAARRIVQGRIKKRDGTEYTTSFIDRVWSTLHRLNRNELLQTQFEFRNAGEELEKQLFFGPVVTSTGLVRGGATFTMRRNTPFQSDAATGAKLALWELYRHGYRVVAFVHDEFLIELPVGVDYRHEAETSKTLICRAMELVTQTVPIDAEYVLTHRWSKSAELWHTAKGQLIPWDTPRPKPDRKPKPRQTRPTQLKASELFQRRKPVRKTPLCNRKALQSPETIHSFIT
jgi:DNA polymerase I-like protein with 3'-5' exonuclease and polymerase domains